MAGELELLLAGELELPHVVHYGRCTCPIFQLDSIGTGLAPYMHPCSAYCFMSE